MLFNVLLWALAALMGLKNDFQESWNLAEMGILPGVFVWAFAILQSCLVFLPLPVPSSSAGKTAALWTRVIAAAFLGGLLIAIPFFALIDLFHLLLFPPQVPLGLIIMSMAQAAIFVAFGIWAVSWLVWIPLLMRRARREADALERFVVKSAKVSAAGLALCLPWYYVIRENEPFIFTLGSFWALVLGLWSLLVIGGPLLFVLARDRRLRAGVRAG